MLVPNGRWALAESPVGAAVAQPVSAAQRDLGYEALLVRSLVQARQGRIDDALDGLRQLLELEPDFELAHFVYGDLLSALSAGDPRLGREGFEGQRAEAMARLEHYLAAPLPQQLPDAVLQLPSSVDSAILVDLGRYRLYVLRRDSDGALLPVSSYYVSIGQGGSDKRFEGDLRTPVGVYFVETYLPGRTLPDLYGEGAFPVDYPNAWDRRLGRTGSGIWVHGTEWQRFSRAPLSSRGCVTLNNGDFLEMRAEDVEVGTPVVFANSVEWVDRSEAAQLRGSLENAIRRWEVDWESRDPERYLSHYGEDFRSGRMDRAAWARHKRLVNASKRFIEVELDDLGLFRYPGEDALFLASFRQVYRSDSFTSSARKRQFWQLVDGEWRIVHEEAAGSG